MDMNSLPEKLIKAILFLRGEEDGWSWLNALPQRMAHYCERWDLTPQRIAEGGATSCCVYCSRQDGIQAVLKIPIDADTGYLETRSLGRWAPSGASPEVLDYAEDSGVYLMTRILPGANAWPVNGPEDSDRFNELLVRLNDPGLPSLDNLQPIAQVVGERLDWADDRFRAASYADMVPWLCDARRALEVVCRDATDLSVLHGDLQAKNVLIGADNRWIAIDPWTAVGDINCEAALWAVVQEGPVSIEDRIRELTKNEMLDFERLTAWAYVLGIAEYRQYLAGQARRIEAFVSSTTVEDVISAVT